MDLWMISLTSGKAPSCRWFSRSQLTESQIRAWSISTPSNFCAAQRTLATKAVNLLSEGIRLLAFLIHSYIFCFFFYQYVGLSVCQSTRLACLSASVSVRLSIYRNVCLPARLSICLSVHLSAGTFACLPVYLSVCWNICLPACLSVYLPVSLSFLLVWLSFFPSFYLFAYLPVRLPFCRPCLFIKVLSYRRVLLSWVFHNLPSATRTMLSKCTERPVLPSVIKSPLVSWKILFEKKKLFHAVYFWDKSFTNYIGKCVDSVHPSYSPDCIIL